MEKTRAEAAKNLDRYYFTGKECSSGHLSKRYTDSGACVACREMYRRKEKWERQRLRSLINAKERAESAIRDASDAEIYQDAAGFRASYNGEFIVVTDVGAEAHDDIADEFIQVRPSDAEHVARILVGVSKLAGGES